jgi:signal transduction histidine kinase
MKVNRPEPGLLSVFRGFTLFYMVLIFALIIARPIVPNFSDAPGGSENSTVLWIMLIMNALLLGYLSWGWLEQRLGGYHLPIAVIVAGVGPIFGEALTLQYQIEIWRQFPAFFGGWQLIPILFVPLVLLAWQYRLRAVIVFAFGTAILELGLTALVFGGFSLILAPFVGLLVIRTIAFLFVGYIVVRLMDRQREARQALTQANIQLRHFASTLEQLTISRERNRLARELHDTLAHTLSGQAVQLEAVKALWDENPDEARHMLDESLSATRAGLTETRRALQDLRASPLDDLGLLLALRELTDSLAARTKIRIRLDLPESLENRSPIVEQTIYRVAQEAMANIDRYSEASDVALQLKAMNGSLELTVNDNGRGFNPEEINRDEQLGLKGMQERAAIVGGDLEVESNPGEGTTIKLRIEDTYERT